MATELTDPGRIQKSTIEIPVSSALGVDNEVPLAYLDFSKAEDNKGGNRKNGDDDDGGSDEHAERAECDSTH